MWYMLLEPKLRVYSNLLPGPPASEFAPVRKSPASRWAIGSVVDRVWEKYNDSRLRRRAIQEFANLDDRLLHDIGLDRDRIPETVDAMLRHQPVPTVRESRIGHDSERTGDSFPARNREAPDEGVGAPAGHQRSRPTRQPLAPRHWARPPPDTGRRGRNARPQSRFSGRRHRALPRRRKRGGARRTPDPGCRLSSKRTGSSPWTESPGPCRGFFCSDGNATRVHIPGLAHNRRGFDRRRPPTEPGRKWIESVVLRRVRRRCCVRCSCP